MVRTEGGNEQRWFIAGIAALAAGFGLAGKFDWGIVVLSALVALIGFGQVSIVEKIDANHD